MLDVKCFLINLDKNAERLRFVDEQLSKNGLVYERIAGIYGQELSAEEIKKSYSAFRARLANGRDLRLGEIGIALSHISTYKKMVEEQIDVALIFEDDVIIGHDILNVLQQIASFIDISQKQVVLLSSWGCKKQMEWGVEPIRRAMMADGYVITLPAARAIIRGNYPVIEVADSWGRWRLKHGVALYRAWPTTVCQAGEFSSDNLFSPVLPMNSIRKYLHKIIHALGLCIDWILFVFTGR